jgi:hypothetical protein
MIRVLFVSVVSLGWWWFGIDASRAGEIEYPQIIKTRFEAVDQKNGGQFVLWSEREKIFYGLDPKLYPAARYVDVVQVTPSVGSTTLTFVEVRTITAQTPDYLYLTGNLRFRVSGMFLKSSNFPSNTNMSAKSSE